MSKFFELAPPSRHRSGPEQSKIAWPGGFCRHDISWRAVQREG